ncbi:nucleic acid dioxygenase ALKBH1-like isoform X2 [Mercenaria mercenaria]|uniref:nucleic acid dioxygenase ALKBH1-like isoform X2 n=1 Tax=Mercenaria mercenaria TaxID=6596 RepID=UPI00234EE635|nr:nucleic acid dioxygenase ALKBH1-like isoform X2 [Mercenaria mercenaria]
MVLPVQLYEPKDLPKFPGLRPVKEWKAFQLKQCEGFIVIPNPFEPKYQRYWIERCLLDFPTKPNRTNLDAHMVRPSQVWHHCVEDDSLDLRKDSLLMKLRWATLGYQYEWNTKEYFADRVQAFPDDLRHLCSYIAAALGYNAYSSEAGIVNYYRMESTLMGHTDVSELDKAAPLISFSFGQSCIFLIGGPTKETEPVPLFLHSGDICLMTGKARLSYHAVPRILPGKKERLNLCFYGDSKRNGVSSGDHMKPDDTDKEHQAELDRKNDQFSQGEDSEMEDDPYGGGIDQKPPSINIIQSEMTKSSLDENVIVTPTVKGSNCSVNELADLMDSVIEKTKWEPFHLYMERSRINVNVRQVLKDGLSLGMSPEKITPCQRSCQKT